MAKFSYVNLKNFYKRGLSLTKRGLSQKLIRGTHFLFKNIKVFTGTAFLSAIKLIKKSMNNLVKKISNLSIHSFFKKTKKGLIFLFKPKNKKKKSKPKTKSKSKPKPKNDQLPGFIYAMKFTTFFFLVILLVAGMTAGAFGYKYTKEARDIMANSQNNTNETSVFYDRTGEHVLYELSGDERRKIVSHEQVSEIVRRATLAAEDDSFYSHGGFDLASIARAFRANLRKGEIVQGGSTITQQLARHLYLSRDQTYERKIREIFIARELEKKMSKDEILNKYLNEVNYGSNINGIEAAAEYYFNKKALDLSVDEAALLAALPKAPTTYSPYGDNKEVLEKRQKNILKRMRTLEFISQRELDEALQKNTLAKIEVHRDEIKAPHFVNYVIDKLKKQLGEEYIGTAGWKITTTLDWEMQQEAEKLLAESKKHLSRYDAENAAIVVINPKTEEILAMAGSVDFFSQEIDGEVNVAVQPRQPGSSFKPVVYAEAFSEGYQPETMLFDVETNFGRDGTGKPYIPHNYNGGYAGVVSMRQALGSSLNIPAVKTLYLAGINDVINFSEQLGITTLKNRSRYGLSLALGGGEVKLLELVGAFGTFAADGKVVDATAIKEIEGEDREKIDLVLDLGDKNESINPEVARKINSILSDNSARSLTFGTNSPLNVSENVAVKTGTTQDYRDAWTIGYTPSLVVGFWAGNNDNSPMKAGAAGSYVAGPIWNDFMTRQLENLPEEEFVDYEPAKSNKFMITGNVEEDVSYYDKKSGDKLDSPNEEDPEDVREKREPALHSILHYINKDDPLGDTKPDRTSEMYFRWEKAVNEKGEDVGDEN